MANDDRKASLAGLTNKQKVTGLLFVVVVIVIIWQVAGLFGGGSSTPTPVASTARKPAPGQAAKSTQTAAATASAPTNAPSADSGDAPPVLTQTNILTIPNEPNVLKEQQQDQKMYLEALNRLQLLKVQREIAETNQQISAAKLAAATSDKKMSDLLTKPAAPQLSASDYATSLGASSGAQILKTPNEIPSVPSQPQAQVQPQQAISYVVISVSMQLNKWTAVVGALGKLYVVNIGDTLPDGSSVTSINKEGIVIEKDSKKRKINIVSSV